MYQKEDIYTPQSRDELEQWYDELDRAFEEENKEWIEEFYHSEVQSEGRVHINLNKYYNG